MACERCGVRRKVEASTTWPRKCDICSSTLSLKASRVSSSSSHLGRRGRGAVERGRGGVWCVVVVGSSRCELGLLPLRHDRAELDPVLRHAAHLAAELLELLERPLDALLVLQRDGGGGEVVVAVQD